MVPMYLMEIKDERKKLKIHGVPFKNLKKLASVTAYVKHRV